MGCSSGRNAYEGWDLIKYNEDVGTIYNGAKLYAWYIDKSGINLPELIYLCTNQSILLSLIF